MPSKRKVAVIGLGPAGAFAARAAYDAGCDVVIYTHGEIRKTPPGAFWLHWIPEDVQDMYTSQQIYVMGKGDAQAYTQLQWGNLADGKTSSSFPSEPVWETGYSPEDVLDTLVPPECEMLMVSHPLSDTDVKDLAKAYEYVFQTFPTTESKAQQPPLQPFVAAAKYHAGGTQNYVVYNGTGKGIVVREANLFGHNFLEFPKNMTVDEVRKQHDLSGYGYVTLKDLHPDTKPWTYTNGKVILVGRMAEWDRRRLSHDVYSKVSGLLK